MRKSRESHEKVKRKLLTSHEKVMKKSWWSHKKVMKKSWESHEKAMRKSWESNEKFMRKSWESYEKVTKKVMELIRKFQAPDICSVSFSILVPQSAGYRQAHYEQQHNKGCSCLTRSLASPMIATSHRLLNLNGKAGSEIFCHVCSQSISPTPATNWMVDSPYNVYTT